jgi:hypothetical protein
MADRPGKTISFYTDINTVEWLEQEAQKDKRSVSNYLTLRLQEMRSDAIQDALDDICALLDAPDWEYPGQVVRDVARALGISPDNMAKKLARRVNGKESQPAEQKEGESPNETA